MYFKEFPKTRYNFKSLGLESVEVLDIFWRVAFNFKPYTLTIAPTQPYVLVDGDTPDIIAHKIYEDSDYWWLVCLYNNIVNPFNSFPRTSQDYSPQGDPDTVVYIEKSGGENSRDIQEGDILLLADDSDTQGFRKSNISYEDVPLPTQDSDGNFKMVKVIEWDPNLRSATIVGEHTDNFTLNSKFIVMGSFDPHQPKNYKSREDNSYVVFWGQIKKVTSWNNRLTGFINNKTGREVSPMTDVTTTKLSSSVWKASDQSVERSGGTDKIKPSTWDYTNTIIGGYLSMSGGGSTWEERYSANFVDLDEVAYLRNRGLQTLRLLSPEYNEAAFSLFQKTLTEERFSVNQFGGLMQTLRNIPITQLGPQGPTNTISY